MASTANRDQPSSPTAKRDIDGGADAPQAVAATGQQSKTLENYGTSQTTSFHPSNGGVSATQRKPRDSKGWDGKLRLKKASDPTTNEEDEASESGESDGPEEVVFGDAIDADEDLCAEFSDDVDHIDLVHCRISSVPALKLDRFNRVERLCLRQNKISKIDLPANLRPHLKELDFYDNVIKHVHASLEGFNLLTNLDLSFNNLKKIEGIAHLNGLADLFLVQNRIRKIENVQSLHKLRNLELGGNKITTIEGLDTLLALEELWLGKNRISELTGLSSLANLKILSIQANKLRTISALEKLTSLEELYVSHNAISKVEGLSSNTKLRIIDISSNPIEHMTGLEELTELEELWASNCKLESFGEVEKQLGDKGKLTTVYLEGNPLQKRQPALYLNKVKLALPRLIQIDANMIPARATFGAGGA